MAFLEKADLTSIIYLEDIDVITEGDDTKVQSAIDVGIAEAYTYLAKYDIPTLFARVPPLRDPVLFESCKAIAVWYLVKLCPANQDTKEITEGARVARSWLKRIQAGDAVPYNWPLVPAPDLDTFFHVASFPKRINNF